MKGQNTLELNTATMIEAVQGWVNDEFVKPLKVIKVEQTTGKGQGSNHQYLFTVVVEEEEGGPEPGEDVKDNAAP